VRIVVTGALGHIGSRLVRTLPRAFAHAEIVMIDDLSTRRHASLVDLPAGASFEFVEADIMTAPLERLFARADAVIHLAAITDAAGSFAIAEDVERVNFAGTGLVAQACVAARVPLVFPSTTSVYGTQAERVDEDCRELRPQSPYAESKLKSEQLLHALAASRGLRHVTCRFGTIFGTSPGMRFHTAVNKFCWQAAHGRPLTVWRDAFRQQRPYLDLGDATRAIEFIVRARLFDGNVYNVLTLNATPAEITDAIARHVPDARLEFVDSPLLNQHSYRVARERFSRLGFEFTGDLARGIAETLEWIGAAAARDAARMTQVQA
jgi:UDP-glucose 4-epimerase